MYILAITPEAIELHMTNLARVNLIAVDILCYWLWMLELAVAVPASIKLLADVLMDIKQCCPRLHQTKTKEASRALFFLKTFTFSTVTSQIRLWINH